MPWCALYCRCKGWDTIYSWQHLSICVRWAFKVKNNLGETGKEPREWFVWSNAGFCCKVRGVVPQAPLPAPARPPRAWQQLSHPGQGPHHHLHVFTGIQIPPAGFNVCVKCILLCWRKWVAIQMLSLICLSLMLKFLLPFTDVGWSCKV